MQGKIEDAGLSPSFSCYSSDNLTTFTAISKVIREDEDFEFSLPASHQQVSPKENDSKSWTLFPVFNPDIQINHENDVSALISGPLRKLFIDEQRDGSESPSYSSSEADELENVPSGTFCVWSPKASLWPKCKKSNSTGSSSGSKKWKIRYLLRRSNSDGKEPMVILSQKQNQIPVDQVLTVGRRSKAQTPVHELFYVQRRAENEVRKRKTYLPYRKDLVGLFGNVNGMGKMLPF